MFAEELKPFLQQALPPYLQALIRQLLALLQGDRSAGLAEDPALDYMDAVELRLLLAALGQG